MLLYLNYDSELGMSYKIRVATDTDPEVYHTWWLNFIRPVRSTPTEKSFHQLVNDALAQYNGKDVDNSYDIEFDTEEDFLAFKLRFI